MGKYSPNIIANSLICCAQNNPSGEVIVYGDRRIRWAELTSRVFRMANALVAAGVKKDDKVAFLFHNRPEFIETNWAIQVAGGVPVPLNYRFVARETAYQANHCDANVLIYESLWKEGVAQAAASMPHVTHYVCLGESGLEGAVDYEAFLNSGADADPRVATDWPDVAVIIYTGGTTGFPKGVMLTYGAHVELFSTLGAQMLVRTLTLDVSPEKHRHLLQQFPVPGLAALAPVLRLSFVKKFLQGPSIGAFLKKNMAKAFSDPDAAKKGYAATRKAMFPSLPFFHDASYASLMMGSLMGNMCFVLPESLTFDPELVFELIQRERVAQVANVPTGWRKLVEHKQSKPYDLGSVQVATTGGGSCPGSLKKQILQLFPRAMVLDGFGQTEMTPVTAFRIDADADRVEDRSVGRPIVEAKIVDEQGKEVPRGEIGEILYRSNTVMKGYYKDEEKTREVLEAGWFRSGDLGYFDANGEIRTVDRKKECINTGGEKVFPLEVEEIIREHPKVDDVSVIGIPDPQWGTSIRAVVVLKPDATAEVAEIIDFCRGQMAGYKLPRSVVFAKEIPRSPVGKMLRQQVKELYG